MKKLSAQVTSNTRMLPGLSRIRARSLSGSWLLWLECPEISHEAKPGQFVMVRCGAECTLPRPFSLHRLDGSRIALLYNVFENGRGTPWLSQRRAGDSLELLGPLGNGFSINPDAKRLLLAAGGIGIAPLRFLADEALKQGKEVTLLTGAGSGSQLCPDELLPAGTNLRKITEDGSEGDRGLVTRYISDYAEEADQVFACGPLPMYREMALNRNSLKLEGKSVQVSLEMRMGCGLGVCYSCTINTRSGLRQVCKDGPVFELADIVWDKLTCI